MGIAHPLTTADAVTNLVKFRDSVQLRGVGRSLPVRIGDVRGRIGIRVVTQHHYPKFNNETNCWDVASEAVTIHWPKKDDGFELE